MTMKEIRIGDTVQIRRGVCGEGYRFRVSEIVHVDSAGRELADPQVYGHNYGPVRLSEVVAVPSGAVATAQRAADALLTSIEIGISDLKRENQNAVAVDSLVTLTDAPGGAIWRVLEIDGDDALIESEGGRRFWRPVARLTTVHGAFRILNPSALLKCDHCAVASINGHLCHEIGCPYMGARWDTESGTWVKQRKCRECGCQVDKGEVCCED